VLATCEPDVDFNEIKNLLNNFDSDRYGYIYFELLRRLFELFAIREWMKSARVLYECLNSCYESFKNGEKSMNNDKHLTASFLIVQEFEMRCDQICFFNYLLNETEEPRSFDEIDRKTAEIWKQLKSHKQMKELHNKAKDFAEAEVIARFMIKIFDTLEDAYPKYKDNLEMIEFLFCGLNHSIPFQSFELKSKSYIGGGAYEILSLHTRDQKLEYKLLKKSNDLRMEYGPHIPANETRRK
jgi:hypothetical protein